MLRREDKMKTRYEVLYEKCAGYISKEKLLAYNDKSSIHIYYVPQDIKNSEKLKKIEIDNTSKHPSLSIYYDGITIKCTKIDDKISEEEITIHTSGSMTGIYSLIIRKKYEFGNPISSEITAGGEKLNDEGLDDLVNAETYEDIVAVYEGGAILSIVLTYGQLKRT